MFKITEITSKCNLKCEYCPQPTMKRPKDAFMSFDTFKKVIRYYRPRWQPYCVLFLHNFGEPLLHPGIIDFVKYASQNGILTGLSTNLLPMTSELYNGLLDAGLFYLSISKHSSVRDRIEKQIATYDLSKFPSVEIRERINNHDWAGQVKDSGTKKVRTTSEKCSFETNNDFVILPDGKINTCCVAAEDMQTGITIDMLLEGHDYRFKKIQLCSHCMLARFDDKGDLFTALRT